MKLKTLKEVYNRWLDEGMDSAAFFFIDELKAEAVKWVKSILSDDENYKDNNLRAEAYGTIEWIKHFFNLTEEELK